MGSVSIPAAISTQPGHVAGIQKRSFGLSNWGSVYSGGEARGMRIPCHASLSQDDNEPQWYLVKYPGVNYKSPPTREGRLGFAGLRPFSESAGISLSNYLLLLKPESLRIFP